MTKSVMIEQKNSIGFFFFKENLTGTRRMSGNLSSQYNSWQKIDLDLADSSSVNLTNHLICLSIVNITIWNGTSKISEVQISSAESPVKLNPNQPFLWQTGSVLHLKIGPAIQLQEMIIEIETLQLGHLLFGNSVGKEKKEPIPSHKPSIKNLFYKEYQFNLMVDAQKTTGKFSDQLNGYAIHAPNPDAPADEWIDPETGKIRPDFVSLTKALQPRTLCYDLSTAEKDLSAAESGFSAFRELCSAVSAIPHIVLNADNISESVLRSLIQNSASEAETRHIWEIQSHQLSQASRDPEHAAELIDQFSAAAKMIRNADPDSEIILPGLTLSGKNQSASLDWDEKLLVKCSSEMDLLGIPWLFPGPKGWTGNRPEIARDAACGLTDVFSEEIHKLASLLSNLNLDRTPRLAITPWGYFKSPGDLSHGYQPDFTLQDAFFYGSMMNHFYRNASLIGLTQIGWLNGPLGLLKRENQKMFGTPPYHMCLVTELVQNTFLKAETIRNETCPSYLWEGIPGIAEAHSVPLLDVTASRSADGKYLCIFVLNRDPYRRAIAKIHFVNFPDMRPIAGKFLKGKNPNLRNTASNSQNVYCKDVKIPNVRKMDHVNIDLPPMGAGSMLLTSES